MSKEFNFIEEHVDVYNGFNMGKDYPPDESYKYYDNYPRFDYAYLNLGTIKQFCFNSPHFTHSDYQVYFQKVRKISEHTIDELIENSDHELHFRIGMPNPHSKEKKILDKLLDKKLSVKETPQIGHFALYTASTKDIEKAKNKNKKAKSPRIFFFIGHKGIFFILYFDPFHDTHP